MTVESYFISSFFKILLAIIMVLISIFWCHADITDFVFYASCKFIPKLSLNLIFFILIVSNRESG